MIRRAGQREKPPVIQLFRLAEGLMWRPKPCYHSLGSGVLRKFTANFPHFRRADVSSAGFDSGRKMLDTCLHSVRPIQQPDSRSFRPDSITLIGDFCTFGVMLFGW